MSQCKGKVIAIGEIKTGESQRGKWASQQWVVEEQGQQYPEHWVLETFGEKNGSFYPSNRPWEVVKEQQPA